VRRGKRLIVYDRDERVEFATRIDALEGIAHGLHR
jgi:hypothetical protein